MQEKALQLTFLCRAVELLRYYGLIGGIVE